MLVCLGFFVFSWMWLIMLIAAQVATLCFDEEEDLVRPTERLALALGFGSWLWLLALALGFGSWLWLLALALGFGSWLWLLALALGSKQRSFTGVGPVGTLSLVLRAGPRVKQDRAGALHKTSIH
jgi:hypothetical protein